MVIWNLKVWVDDGDWSGVDGALPPFTTLLLWQYQGEQAFYLLFLHIDVGLTTDLAEFLLWGQLDLCSLNIF